MMFTCAARCSAPATEEGSVVAFMARSRVCAACLLLQLLVAPAHSIIPPTAAIRRDSSARIGFQIPPVYMVCVWACASKLAIETRNRSIGALWGGVQPRCVVAFRLRMTPLLAQSLACTYGPPPHAPS